jgi:hypothetical protein
MFICIFSHENYQYFFNLNFSKNKIYNHILDNNKFIWYFKEYFKFIFLIKFEIFKYDINKIYLI